MIDIRWAPLSRHHLERIDTYYRAIDPEIATETGRRILAAAAFLRELPMAGPVAIRGDRRKWRVAGTSYVLFYRVMETHIRILRVLHSVQDQRTQ